MSKTTKFVILDTETCTLPFVNEWQLSSDDKKKISIAKPLVYDMGWTLATRTHGIIEKKNYLVAETFCVPSIFDTAYYKEKRPLYLAMLERGEIEVKPWNEIIEILIEDLKDAKWICAYNAMFDFKKAIVFTETYINRLYSPSYYEWENQQKDACRHILATKPRNSNRDFDEQNFILRGVKYPMIDIWGLACAHLLNNSKYKKYCLTHENGLSNSGTYFSTNAENAMRYMSENYGFIEDHTALSDAEIETALLFTALKRGKIIPGITYFPFKMLGDTVDFVTKTRGVTFEMARTVFFKIDEYLGDDELTSSYQKMTYNKMCRLAAFIEEKWGE